MKFRVRAILFCSVLMWTSGCAMHNVKFVPASAIKVPPTNQATTMNGNVDEASRLMEQSRLPHNTARQRFDLETQAGHALRSQLGSDDYVVLGEVWGGGNAYSNMESLKIAFCKKAASVGGDVVLIFRTGVEDRPYVYSTPGYSNTTMQYSGNTYGQSYGQSGYSSYTQGTATANTTYTPGQTYAGVMHFPYANGLVFKYVPGVTERRQHIAALSDAELERVVNQLQALSKTNVTWDEFQQQADNLVASRGQAGAAH